MQEVIVVLVQLCLILSAQALTEEQKDKVTKHGLKCLAETNVDISLVEKGQHGEFIDDPLLEEFVYCFLKASEIIDKDGHPRANKIKEKLSHDATASEINKFLTKCVPTASTPQKRAAELWKCYWETSSVHIILQ
ncbi:odorant binding protein-related [Holotrichia oblita]|uniref:Odorant binding protein-related n=1 Tax=Holotrichia oblita TaxID=644536 RepID=A0ACB9TPN4_HOLOL|nr:odorant binding protein-related [Holotrichia oblita]